MTVSVHTEDRLLVINPDQDGYDLTEEEAIEALSKMRLTCQYLREQIARSGRERILASADGVSLSAEEYEFAE